MDGVLLKSSDYTVSYFRDEAMKEEIKGNKNNVELSGDDPVTVHVKITGKGNYGLDTAKYAKATYRVCRKKDNEIDLKGARITFKDKDVVKSKFEYTSKEIKPEVVVQVKEGRNMVPVDPAKYTVEYHNNILKGKATVVVKAVDGKGAVGGKSATFSIVSGNVEAISK